VGYLLTILFSTVRRMCH